MEAEPPYVPQYHDATLVPKSPRPHRQPYFYIPCVLRIPTLLVVFLFSVALIGVVEYGIRMLPHAEKSKHTNPQAVMSSLVQKRQSASFTMIPSAYIATSTPRSPSSRTAAPNSYVPTVSPTVTTRMSMATTVITSSVFTTDAAGKVTTLVTYVPTTSVGTATVETVMSTYKNNIWGSSSDHFPLWQVFVGNYLVLIVAVVFRQIWSAIHAQTKLIEPFTRLMEPQGILASNVLHSFYLSSSMIPDPVLALAKRRWLVLWVSLVHFTVGFLAPLGSELLFLNTKWCPHTNDLPNPCWPPRLSIDPLIARLTQGLLTFVAIMTLPILAIGFRMRTGVYSDPSAIASIASLVHHPEVLQDFRTFNHEVSTKDVQRSLDDKRYKLDEYQRYDGVWRYGLVPVIPNVKSFVRDGPRPVYKLSKSRKRKDLDTILDVVFGLVLLALLGVVAGYYKDGAADSFNNFFSSATFGPRFILTGAGTIIAINWKRLERDVHTLSPYHRMAQSSANPRSTILLRNSSIPLTSIFTMLFNRHFFASIIAVVAVLADLLTIFLGVVPFEAGQVFLELLVACFVSIGVLGVMVLSVAALIVWKHRLPNLPLLPNTIAAVGSYVSYSRMLSNFEGCEYLDDRDLANRVVSLGKRYVYGKELSSDGQLRYLVDEEITLEH